MKVVPTYILQQGFEADYQYGTEKAFEAIKPSQVGRLYVDCYGREREEIFVMDGTEWELVFIEIWDVVALKNSTLSPSEKQILLQEPIDLKVDKRILGLEMPGVVLAAFPRRLLPSGRELGVKQIEGLTCKGVMIENPSNGGNPGFTAECWYSEVISYLVFVKVVFGKTAVENIFRLSNIRLVEPAKELFTIPTDYKQAEVSYSMCSIGKNDESTSP